MTFSGKETFLWDYNTCLHWGFPRCRPWSEDLSAPQNHGREWGSETWNMKGGAPVQGMWRRKNHCGHVCLLSHSVVSDSLRPHTIAHQAPLSMGFSSQEYWCGWPSPTLGDLPDPEIKPTSLSSPALAGRFLTTCTTCTGELMSPTPL